MRIIAGAWKGRTVRAPKGNLVRPTADRVREAWMSIVHPWLEGARVLDLCAGSGALGLEALSRGAAWVDFVEKSGMNLRVLEKNVENFKAGERCTLLKGDAMSFVERIDRPYDVAFADPPYGEGLAVALAERWLVAPFAAIFGVEHESRVALPDGGDTRRYGDTAITFYRTK